MIQDPLISIIVPIYNSAAFLPKCLDSILNQTYQNIEILLIDDGSSDNSREICNRYAKKDTRITVVHKKHEGVSAARNSGLKIAVGDWIGFVDSDDFIEPDMYSYLLSLAQDNQAEIAQCGVFYENGEEITDHIASNSLFVGEPNHLPQKVWLYFENSNYCKLYQKSIVMDVLFDTDYCVGEDLLFNMMVLKKAKRIALGNQAKYHYLQHPDSLCHGQPTRKKLYSLQHILEYLEANFCENKTLQRHFHMMQILNALDICHKIVVFRLNDVDDIRKKEQGRLRRNILNYMCCNSFSAKEKLKMIIVGWGWPVYNFLLLKKHKGKL